MRVVYKLTLKALWWAKITNICLICDQNFANVDVFKTHISFPITVNRLIKQIKNVYSRAERFKDYPYTCYSDINMRAEIFGINSSIFTLDSDFLLTFAIQRVQYGNRAIFSY